ncbi:MAG TPA: hypothetical protein VD813_05865 [Pseudonocardia sp.]|nr:hypothetical protein [Pseudonocardia sp.]
MYGTPDAVHRSRDRLGEPQQERPRRAADDLRELARLGTRHADVEAVRLLRGRIATAVLATTP